MPAITATAVMVLTNVGLQFFNNWRGAKTNEELRKKQQEFQEAAQEQNHDRMMQLLREGHVLQEQMELQMHEDRIKNISQDFDELIKRVFLADALKEWPLRVLPMVMKNQSIGSFRAKSNENIALHVIFTPSNCPKFNAAVFPYIEQGLEAFCNQHWNTLSSHPIIFYSGAWKTGTAPDDNEISLLQSSLPNLPVLMITPYFKHIDGKLVFKINMWGAGENQQVEIQPTEQELSYYNVYAPEMNYGDEIASTTIEEFVPYLQCMIGYLADVYFWSAHGVAPILPSLLTIGAINTDGMKYLIEKAKDQYYSLAKECAQEVVKEDNVFYSAVNPIAIYNGAKVLWNADKQNPIETLYDEVNKKEIELEVINLKPLSLPELYKCIASMRPDYLEPTDFIFVLWNDSVIVGTFVNIQGNPAMSKTLQYHYCIFTNEEQFSAQPNSELEYYNFNLNTSNLSKMKNGAKNPVFSMRERLGKILIKHGESLLKDIPKTKEPTSPSSVWGNMKGKESVDFTLENLRDFFVQSIDEQKVPAQAIDNDMSISIVLNWLQQLDLTQVDANKLYLLKAFVEKYDRFMYCAFLGNDNTLFLSEKCLNLTKCYICQYESNEMKDIFGEKSLYVIPFEK